MRELCVRCRRSRATCFCASVRPFTVGFDLVLLQHPNERRCSVTTARMTHLCVAGSTLFEGAGFAGHARVNAMLADPARHCVVLYPGPGSVEAGSPEWRVPDGRKLTVFVIDGTWSTAATMLRRTPAIAALPRISFRASGPSGYRFKRQPRPECLSTIEATHELIAALEPGCEPRGRLLELFDTMVESQLRFASLNPRSPWYKKLPVEHDRS